MKDFIVKTILLFIVLFCMGCKKNDQLEIDYREEMREFVIEISEYGKAVHSKFLVIPQNGLELITQNGEANGLLHSEYISAIDGVGQEDLFYGYLEDNEASPINERDYILDFCTRCEENNIEVLITDYCTNFNKMDDSYVQNESRAFISFAAPERDLNVIPNYPKNPYQVNSNNIEDLSDAKNFLYLIDSENYTSKEKFISALKSTHYDIILMDLYHEEAIFSFNEIQELKQKANGGQRLVICYMSIGEAEDYRFYWNPNWAKNPPVWLEKENPNWDGNYKVHYWNDEWKKQIMGSPQAYFDLVLSCGFDGIYLDIIDAFEYFEEL